MEFKINSIGVIRSPFGEGDDIPIQPRFSEALGTVIVDPKYLEGLRELDGFSHIILLYYFDRASEEALTYTPFLDDTPKGIFAIRHFNRPNRIGISIVQLTKIEENKLFVKGIDVLDETPLIDIKPYVPEFDFKGTEETRIGWLNKRFRNQESE